MFSTRSLPTNETEIDFFVLITGVVSLCTAVDTGTNRVGIEAFCHEEKIKYV
jgi:hypothetical protein